jgi:ABC-type sugar transport system ATPase subunit
VDTKQPAHTPPANTGLTGNGFLLEMRGISKSFPGVQALKEVHFDLLPGEVHALVGENGAGKSTLMKILAGAYQKDDGEILIRGERVNIDDPISAQNLGISMIYQELNLVPTTSVAENIFLGRLPALGGWGHLDWAQVNRQAASLLERVGMDVDPRQTVRSLSVAKKQMVEIAKALSTDAQIIVMDEPTSALTLGETETLFEIIRNLKSQGVSVVFISHRLEEVFAIADRVTVFRDGEHIATKRIQELDSGQIVSMMVGRELKTLFPKVEAQIKEVILEVRNLNKAGKLYDIDFSVRSGEIVGMAGLVGAGRTDLAKAIFGIDPADSGEVLINGRPVEIESPSQAIELGLGLVPEDRKDQALILARPVKENISIAIIRSLSRFGFAIRHEQEDRLVDQYVQQLGIRTPSKMQLVKNLSGGNQQKVIIARWLAARPKVLIVDEPTRGIDVGAKAEIHLLLGKLAQDGVGILMISSELPEILAVSDRVIVMHEGRITGEFLRKDANQRNIMEAATGENLKKNSVEGKI